MDTTNESQKHESMKNQDTQTKEVRKFETPEQKSVTITFDRDALRTALLHKSGDNSDVIISIGYSVRVTLSRFPAFPSE